MDNIERNELTDIQKSAIKEVYMNNVLATVENMLGQRAVLDVFNEAGMSGDDFVFEVTSHIDEKVAVKQAREDLDE